MWQSISGPIPENTSLPNPQHELRDFTAFVHGCLASNEPCDLSLAELFEQWRLRSSSSSEYTTNVAAINASIYDFVNGDHGTPAGEHSQELRQEYGIRRDVNAAIQEGLADVEAGRHRAADEVMDELRKKHGLPGE